MFLCGAEEPLRPNPQIYELDENTGAVELGTASIMGANRYSLVWQGPQAESSAGLTQALTEIVTGTASSGTWCAVWVHHDRGDLAGQSRTTRWQHERQGWDVFVDDDLAIATKPISAGTISWPSERSRSKVALFLGASIPAKALAQRAARPSMRLFARTRMAPSRNFIEWLIQVNGSIVYLEYNDVGRLGCIIAGAQRVPIDRFESLGLIEEIRWNEFAPSVWR